MAKKLNLIVLEYYLYTPILKILFLTDWAKRDIQQNLSQHPFNNQTKEISLKNTVNLTCVSVQTIIFFFSMAPWGIFINAFLLLLMYNLRRWWLRITSLTSNTVFIQYPFSPAASKTHGDTNGLMTDPIKTTCRVGEKRKLWNHWYRSVMNNWIKTLIRKKQEPAKNRVKTFITS